MFHSRYSPDLYTSDANCFFPTLPVNTLHIPVHVRVFIHCFTIFYYKNYKESNLNRIPDEALHTLGILNQFCELHLGGFSFQSSS